MNTENTRKRNILLLTNRDSDNQGDHAIELCDIGLIHAAMQNLGFDRSEYQITSRAAGMITQRYLKFREPEELEFAENLVRQADVVVFGGAPLFNYQPQVFYERTAITLELAQTYNVPVLFSAIGVEQYDEDNPKCQRLKKTLNFDVVRQITTRDGYDLLQKYVENPAIEIGKVADPATFSDCVFSQFIQPVPERPKKKVGLFVLRASGFSNYGFNLSKEGAAEFWLALIRELERKGYDYELLTSGHCADEAFLDRFFSEFKIPDSKIVSNTNLPEELASRIAQYDAVISTRLHPSILSFAMDVPALGLVWNNKVAAFYENIQHPERAIQVTETTPEEVAARLDEIMGKPAEKDPNYLITVYDTLFRGLKGVFSPASAVEPYGYEALRAAIPPYAGSSPNETQLILKRKFRRIYRLYNGNTAKIDSLDQKYDALQAAQRQKATQIKKLQAALDASNAKLEQSKTKLEQSNAKLAKSKEKLEQSKQENRLLKQQWKKERAKNPFYRIRRFLSRLKKKLLGKS